MDRQRRAHAAGACLDAPAFPASPGQSPAPEASVPNNLVPFRPRAPSERLISNQTLSSTPSPPADPGQFVSERCQVAPGLATSFADLYAAYCQWARERDQEPASQNAFGRALTRLGCPAWRIRQRPTVWGRLGIGLNPGSNCGSNRGSNPGSGRNREQRDFADAIGENSSYPQSSEVCHLGGGRGGRGGGFGASAKKTAPAISIPTGIETRGPQPRPSGRTMEDLEQVLGVFPHLSERVAGHRLSRYGRRQVRAAVEAMRKIGAYDLQAFLSCYPPDWCLEVAEEIDENRLQDPRSVKCGGALLRRGLRRLREAHVLEHPELYDAEGWALDAPNKWQPRKGEARWAR